MFFKKGEEMDEKWKVACDLYHQGKLTGIRSMKVSTTLYDPKRTSDVTNSVICFYCGPANDETSLMAYGKNLLTHISYGSNFLNYRSDAQTRAGTFATGQKINSMYRIKVSNANSTSSEYSRNNRGWFKQTTKHNNNIFPSAVSTDHDWRKSNSSQDTNWRSRDRKYRESSYSKQSAVPNNVNWRERNKDSETNWRTSYSSFTDKNWRRRKYSTSQADAKNCTRLLQCKGKFIKFKYTILKTFR